MHILFLTDNFPPEVNAPASRTYEHAREWVKRGHKVTIITGAPNFPKGKVFQGYKNRIWQREEMNGIQVIRVYTYIAKNSGKVRRILDYLSFMLSSIIAASFVPKVDVVVGTSPQFFTACAAYIISSCKRIPFVFEVRDLWPESIKAVGAMRDSRWLRWMESLELYLYKKAALIVAVTQSFKVNLVNRGVDESKVHVVTNGVDITRFMPMEKDVRLLEKLDLTNKFVAGYIGTMGLAHGLNTLLEAALKLQSEWPEFRLLMLGDGASRNDLEQNAQKMGVHNVLFINTVSKDEVVRYWSALDVSIIHLRHVQLFTSVIPSKLFEGMGMGIPVLLGVDGESARIVTDNDIGLTFEPENTEALVSKLLLMKVSPEKLNEFSKNAAKLAQKYSRSLLALEMLELIERHHRDAD